MAASQVEIAVSNMDLYPLDLPGRASWSSHVEQLDEYLDDTGFANFEIHPTEATLFDARKSVADVRKRDKVNAVIGSMHQTFNDGTGLVGRLGKVSGLELSGQSYNTMVAMQRGLKPLPLVVYPGLTLEQNIAARDLPLSPLVMQPSPEIYRDYEISTGSSSNAALMERMGEIGIRGLCPDTAHARRKAEDGFEAPKIGDVWAEQFASGSVYQMHVALDRVDMAGIDKELAQRSHDEFEAFVKSGNAGLKTEMGDMLVAAIENWRAPHDLGGRVLRMVVEVPPLPRQFLRRKAQHMALLDSLAQLVESTGAVPLTRR